MIKAKKIKGIVAIAAVVLAWCCIVLAVAYAASTTLDNSISGLSATYDGGKWTADGTTFTGSVTSTSSGTCSTSYEPVTSTLTLTNNSGARATLYFDWSLGESNGTYSVDGDNENTIGHVNKELAAGNSVTVMLESSADAKGCDPGISMTLSNISLEIVSVPATTMFEPAEHGTYTVDGKSIGRGMTSTRLSTEPYTLLATPDDGYMFVCWKDISTGEVLSKHEGAILNIDVDRTVTAVFVPADPAMYYIKGNDSTQYKFLDEAIDAAGSSGTIVVGTSGTVYSSTGGTEFTIPSGVTLLVPYDDAGTVVTTKASTNTAYSTPSEFRRLTLSGGADIICNGTIVVMSQIHAGSGSNNTSGAPTGPYGRIQMDAGSSITVNSGAYFYAYGFVTGTGLITAKNGAKIHETFQIGEFGGGSRYYAMKDNSYKVFPFNHYFVKNIEAPIVFEYGATDTLHTALFASDTTAQVDNVGFIGSSSGLFLLKGSSSRLTRQYLPAEDRMEYIIDGDTELGEIALSVSFGIIMTVDVNSSDYVLPITSNMFIHVRSGTTTISSDIEFIPGSKLVVDSGATVKASANFFAFDSYEWLKATNGASTYTGTSSGCHLVGSGSGYGFVYSNLDLVNAYSPTRAFVRTADNLEDAVIDVNGNLTVTGYLNTTTSGAKITSSEGAGQVVLSNNAVQNLYQATNNGGSNISGYVGIYQVGTTSAQLKNGAEYEGTDKEYIQTAVGGTGTYKYDKATDKWYKFKVDYVFNGATLYTDYIFDGTSSYEAAGITGASATASNGTVSISGSTVSVTGITADSTVTLSGSAANYTPYFVLSEKQYGLYRRFAGNTVSDTVSIGEGTYYIVQQESESLSLGTALIAPTDVAMGVTNEAHNSITWRLSDSPVGDVFGGTVPQGEAADGPVYIYGFYSGSVASVSVNGTTSYYSTLERAFDALEMNKTSAVTMLVDCGSYEEEDGAATLRTPAGSAVTFDLAGHTAIGSIINNGTMTIELNGGIFKRDSAEVQSSASAAVTNMGTMTVRNSGTADDTHGVISNNSWRTASGGNASNINATAEYFQAVIRNSGENAYLTVESGVTLSQEEEGYTPTMAEDRFDAVGIVNFNGATLADSKANISVPKGAAIYNLGGVIERISGGTVTAYQGVYNRNIRTATGVTSTVATIDTIGGDVSITVTRYAVHNRAVVNTIGENAYLQSADYTVYCRGDQWYFDTNLTRQTNSSSDSDNYRRVNSYQTDESRIATINTVSGGTIKATTNFAVCVANGGILEEISGGTITAPKQAIRVIGYRTSGDQTTEYFDKNGGVVKTQDTKYEGSRLKRISGGTVTTTGGSYTIENYAYIDEITGGTFTSSGGITIANLNYETYQYSRIQLERTANATTYDNNKTYNYFQATIGSISGVTVNAGNSGGSNQAILNRGLINSIDGVVLNGSSYVLTNGDGVNNTCSKARTTIQRFVDSSNAGEKDVSRTYYVPTITSVNNTTVAFTKCGLRNYGHIGTITNSTISTTGGEQAIDNESYIRTSLDYTYTWDGKTPTVSTTTTGWTAGEIDLIGSGNTIKATTNVIINFGTINAIDGGGTSTVTATNGVAIYNYRGLPIADNGSGYVDPVIGTIKNVQVTAAGYGIQNGEGNATYGTATINELADGVEVKSSGDDAVHNMASAKLCSVSGGIFTTSKGEKYALKNENAANSTLVSGGDFKGGTADRAYAIYDPDNTARQTYPEGKVLTGTESVTLHDGAVADGYYYLADTFTVTFDMQGHGTPIDPLTGVVSGSTIAAPDAPTADRFIFGGWYKDAACTAAWDFGTDTVTADTILYAKWDEITTVTVTFDVDGATTTQEVDVGATATAPATPTKDGYEFKEWQLNGAAYDFGTPVTENITLTAAWRKLLTNGDITVTVADAVYTGSALTPEITVTCDGTTLTAGTDYTVEITGDRINAGDYTVILTGTGNYAGSRDVTFTINKAAPTLSVTMENWHVGLTAKTPAVTGNEGNGAVTFAYKVAGAGDDTYSENQPTEAGTYTVRASVAATTNYDAATATADFTVTAHSLTKTEAVAPTCTEAGNSAYWTCSVCGKHYSDENGTTEIEADSWILPATGHSWGQPVWTWAEDYSSASASFTCSVCGESFTTETVTATESVGEAGAIVYTVTVTFDGNTYTDTREYRKLDHGSFTIVGYSDVFNPDLESSIVTVTDAANGVFTATFNAALAVAVKTVDTATGEDVYTRLHAAATSDADTFSFDLRELGGDFEPDIEIVVAMKGDLNGSGNVNAMDAILLEKGTLRPFSSYYVALNSFQKFVGDIDFSGNVNAMDVVMLKKSILRTISSYYSPLKWDIPA